MFLVETHGKTFFAHFFVLPETPRESPHPRKQSRRVNNLTESDRRDQDSFSPRWERPVGPPALRRRGPGLWYQLVSSLLSCKFCTKNCYFFSLFFFFLSLVVLLCFVFFFFPVFTPRPLCLRLCLPFRGQWNRWASRHREGNPGIAATFSPIGGFLPNCAAEEVIYFAHEDMCSL